MGVRILADQFRNHAVLFCSTSDWAFGPLFGEDEHGHDAEERAEAFLRWLKTTDTWSSYDRHPLVGALQQDARQLTDAGLQQAHSDWLAQEQAQWAREAAAEDELFAEDR